MEEKKKDGKKLLRKPKPKNSKLNKKDNITSLQKKRFFMLLTEYLKCPR